MFLTNTLLNLPDYKEYGQSVDVETNLVQK